MNDGTKTALNAIEQAIDEYRQEIKRLEGEVDILEKMRGIALEPRRSPPLTHAQVATRPQAVTRQRRGRSGDSYPWTKLIKEVFDEYGQISLMDLRKILHDKGYPALEKRYNAAIQALVSRQLGKTIERVGEAGSGVYRKIGYREQVSLKDVIEDEMERGQ